jgi:hypothetical protein
MGSVGRRICSSGMVFFSLAGPRRIRGLPRAGLDYTGLCN